MALEKLGRFFGISDDDELVDEGYAEEQEDTSATNSEPNNSKIVSINSGMAATSKIVLYEPRVYADAKEVAQNLLNNKAIIINFSRMDDESSRRIVDFVTGTVYALNGEIQRVGDKIFLATPPKFETDGKITELVEKKDKLS